MRKMLLAALAATLLAAGLGAQEWNRVPMTWKWISGGEVAFSYDGSFSDRALLHSPRRAGRSGPASRRPGSSRRCRCSPTAP